MESCEEEFHRRALSLLGPIAAPTIGQITERLPALAICMTYQLLIENSSVARPLVVGLKEVLLFLMDTAYRIAVTLEAAVQGLIDAATSLDKNIWKAILSAIFEGETWFDRISGLLIRVVADKVGGFIGGVIGGIARALVSSSLSPASTALGLTAKSDDRDIIQKARTRR